MKLRLTIIALLLWAANIANAQLITGAEQINEYINQLNGKKVGIVANHTSYINQAHLVDTLLSLNTEIVKIFSPEHGFKGDHADGASIKDGKYLDIPVISLFGKNVKMSQEHLTDVEIIVFDLQDVGTRFYTYISTMTYVMEACAQKGIPMIVLDRPNPNGNFIDGPTLDPKFKSFVGMHKVPAVYGMTIGEYALMVNGENWLPNHLKCNLTIIKLKNYNRKLKYDLPISPSPNLQSFESIILYPSLCFFEGTEVSVGRGTSSPFEVIGLPGYDEGHYSFTPRSIPGVSDKPKYKDQTCKGYDLKEFANNYIINYDKIYLFWLVSFYNASNDQENFFNNYFDLLAGTDQLRKQIIDGKSVVEIRESWEKDINDFKEIRKKYLVYKDFE